MTEIMRRAGKDMKEKRGIIRIIWRQCDKQGEKLCGRSRRGSVSNSNKGVTRRNSDKQGEKQERQCGKQGEKQQGSHQEKQ